jgi:hypothetical protein
MLCRYIFGEPMPTGGICPGEQVLPGPHLHNEHAPYTAKRLLPVTHSPLSSSCPTRAVLPGAGSPLSSSGSPSRPTRVVLPGTGMPMSGSSGPLRPARALAHWDVCFPEVWTPQIDTA